MFHKKMNLHRVIFSVVFALGLTASVHTDVHAAYVNDTVNGVSYSDEDSVAVKYCSDYSEGGGSYSFISLNNEGDRVANVKSSSPNLIAKKTYESYSISSSTDYDSEWDETKQEYVSTQKTTKQESYGYSHIAYFAKKAGSYKVTFDVLKPDGTKRCTKTIKVTASGSGSASASPVKSVKYNGKELYNYYPFTNIMSGKLSVKLNAKYKLVKLEVGKMNSKGEYVYKATKNNKKITLAKSAKHTESSSWSDRMYDPLFPHTYIRITYQNKKTKEKETYTTSLATINK